MTALEQKFTADFEEYNDAIFRHCLFRVFNREKALELTQETFMKTWKYLADGKEIDNIRAFLYRTATNLIIDHSRKKKEQSLDIMQESGFDPGHDTRDKLADKIEIDHILEIAKEMDDQYREVLLLRHLDGFKPRHIAEMLGENTNVISVRINRAAKQLKQLLKEKQYGEKTKQ